MMCRQPRSLTGVAAARLKRVLPPAGFALAMLNAASAYTAESQTFWDLKPEQLRTLVAAPQVMVTRTASGVDAYCRCPVVLKPNEIPEAVKKAIIAVEDRRFMDHGGVDLIALGSVLRGGLSRGGSTSSASVRSPMCGAATDREVREGGQEARRP